MPDSVLQNFDSLSDNVGSSMPVSPPAFGRTKTLHATRKAVSGNPECRPLGLLTTRGASYGERVIRCDPGTALIDPRNATDPNGAKARSNPGAWPQRLGCPFWNHFLMWGIAVSPVNAEAQAIKRKQKRSAEDWALKQAATTKSPIDIMSNKIELEFVRSSLLSVVVGALS